MQAGDLHDVCRRCRRVLCVCQEPSGRGLGLRRPAGGRWVPVACPVSLAPMLRDPLTLLVVLAEEYEAYMKKQEVTVTVQEPRVADVAPVVWTTVEQMTTTVISGQVG